MVLAPLPFEILLFPLIFIRCENTRQVKYLKGANGSLAQPVNSDISSILPIFESHCQQKSVGGHSYGLAQEL